MPPSLSLYLPAVPSAAAIQSASRDALSFQKKLRQFFLIALLIPASITRVYCGSREAAKLETNVPRVSPLYLSQR